MVLMYTWIWILVKNLLLFGFHPLLGQIQHLSVVATGSKRKIMNGGDRGTN